MIWASVFVLPLHSQPYVGPDVRRCRAEIVFVRYMKCDKEQPPASRGKDQ